MLKCCVDNLAEMYFSTNSNSSERAQETKIDFYSIPVVTGKSYFTIGARNRSFFVPLYEQSAEFDNFRLSAFLIS